MKKVLTIAGSDCSGGAGIQADLKTMMAHHVYGMSVITAVTAQNTVGVQGIFELPPEFVGTQLDAIFTDIVPDAVKIGMVCNHKIIEIITEKLVRYQVKNVVLDPVMISTSGRNLLEEEARRMLIDNLVPNVDLITPNLSEAQALSGILIEEKEDMIQAARKLEAQMQCAILVKGGHLQSCADDLLIDQGREYWYTGKQIHNPNTHGTGCTLSSAIASNLALGYSRQESVKRAKEYITGAIQCKMNLGHGNGPLNHDYKN